MVPAPPTLADTQPRQYVNETRHLLTHEDPLYPPAAQAKHIQGQVVVTATINEDGRLSDFEVVSSPDPLLTKATFASLKNRRYEPFVENGQPVKKWTKIYVRFSLPQ
jgi:TonB family protein